MDELKELAKGDDRILFTGFVQGAMLDELYSIVVGFVFNVICYNLYKVKESFAVGTFYHKDSPESKLSADQITVVESSLELFAEFTLDELLSFESKLEQNFAFAVRHPVGVRIYEILQNWKNFGYQSSTVLDEPEREAGTTSIPIPQCEESENIPLPDLSEQPENVQRPGSEVVEKGLLT